LHVWRPVWRPRFLWLRETARYYLRFGSRTMTESALSEALDNLDDIWTGAYLGHNALGLYSRAYAFATYPRRLLAMPVNMVAGGTYAELKHNRQRLSRAFFRTNALLVRTGFLMGGLLALVAPEFVWLALGDKWLPMVPAFRLMVVFALLDPIRTTVSSLFIAAGRPEQVIRVRLVQLAVLVTGLFVLGRVWGITGVAVVVDGVLLIGLIPLLYRARDYVDYSARRLFVAPGLALVVGAGVALAASWAACDAALCPNDWLTGAIKSIVFTATFAGLLYALERREIMSMLARLRLVYTGRRSAVGGR
jgi:O-antigen/teichoic acid export membrane protein